MKKTYVITAALAVLSIVSITFAGNLPELPTQNGQPINVNRGLLAIATPTVTLDDVTAKDVSDYLSSATNEAGNAALMVTGFEIRAKTGAFVICDSTNIATGTNRIGRLVSEGESYTWNGLATTFEGQVIANDTSAVIVFDQVWGW